MLRSMVEWHDAGLVKRVALVDNLYAGYVDQTYSRGWLWVVHAANGSDFGRAWCKSVEEAIDELERCVSTYLLKDVPMPASEEAK